jgi:hypothetical protein
MDYKTNFRILIPTMEYEELRGLSQKTKISRSQLARLAKERDAEKECD